MLVGHGVGGDGLAVGVDIDASVTAVAGERDEGAAEAELGHPLLVVRPETHGVAEPIRPGAYCAVSIRKP